MIRYHAVPTSTSNLVTVLMLTPANRDVARMLFPSTSRARIRARSCRLKRFIVNIMLERLSNVNWQNGSQSTTIKNRRRSRLSWLSLNYDRKGSLPARFCVQALAVLKGNVGNKSHYIPLWHRSLCHKHHLLSGASACFNTRFRCVSGVPAKRLRTLVLPRPVIRVLLRDSSNYGPFSVPD